MTGHEICLADSKRCESKRHTADGQISNVYLDLPTGLASSLLPGCCMQSMRNERTRSQADHEISSLGEHRDDSMPEAIGAVK